MLGTIEGDLKVVRKLNEIPNVHEDGHERRYLISPDEMFRLEREARSGGLKILGFYHSHPDHPARPSGYDRDWAWPWYSYIIVSSRQGVTGEMTCWELDEERNAFAAEKLLPWTERRAEQFASVFSELSEEDRIRCLPLTDTDTK